MKVQRQQHSPRTSADAAICLPPGPLSSTAPPAGTFAAAFSPTHLCRDLIARPSARPLRPARPLMEEKQAGLQRRVFLDVSAGSTRFNWLFTLQWAVNVSVSRYLSERLAICLLLARERERGTERERERQRERGQDAGVRQTHR